MKLILKNCLTTFSRFKTATFLNVVGLSVAFAVFIVITTQLRHEFTYDTFYPNGENIYRLEVYDSLSQRYAVSCGLPLYESLAATMPGIINFGAWRSDFKVPFTRIDENGVKRVYAEQRGAITMGMLDLFSMEIVAGDARATLEDPQQFIIPESIALRIFGHDNPIGQTLWIYEQAFLIGAVYKDFPKNSSITNALYSKLEDTRWDMWSYVGFFELMPGVDVAELNRKINESDAAGLGLSTSGDEALEDFEWVKKNYSFSLKPVKEIYFSDTIRYGYGDAKVGNRTMSYVLMLIGILIMVVAYVNFTNFSTALAPVRIKSINTRRVMGASLGMLRGTIIAEAALLSLLSFALSLLWVFIFSQSTLSMAFFDNPTLNANMDILVATGILSIVFGGLAGAYPSGYMTSFQPALVLNGSFSLTPQGIRLRNVLITVQFFTAMALITGSLFIKLQHNYLRYRPIGMDRDNIVVVKIEQELNILSHLSAVTNEMMEYPYIYDYTTSLAMPGAVGLGIGRDFDGKQIQVRAWSVGYNFLDFFNIPVVEGDDFFEQNLEGTSRFIFNRRAIDMYDLENPIGKELKGFPINSGPVVGIAADAHFASLHQGIEPLVFMCGDDQEVRYLFLKIDSENTPATIAHIKNVYTKYSDNEIDLRFLDQELDKLYTSEANLANIISLFSLITIIISLMGIYGLILFNAKFKVREIGIRKVNGASEMEIVLLLNRGFLRLIVLAFLIATPISYYMVSNWLQGFPYRVALHGWVFVLSGVLTMGITLLTVSWQSWKAAVQNPVKAIKAE